MPQKLRLGAVDIEIELRRLGLEQRKDLHRARASAPPRPIMAPTAPCSACGPRPPRSSTIMRKPPALPMPVTDGGWTTTMKASWISPKRLNSSPWMPAADLRGSAARASQGSSTRKIAPAFDACVKVAPEKPTMFTDMRDARNLHGDVARALHHRVGARERCARRKLRRRDQIAAVDLRDEARRRAVEFEEAVSDDPRIERRASARRSARRGRRASHSRARARRSRD